MVVQGALHEVAARALAAGGRLRALAARRALPDHRALACLLLALGHHQLALDMMARLRRRQFRISPYTSSQIHYTCIETKKNWWLSRSGGGSGRYGRTSSSYRRLSSDGSASPRKELLAAAKLKGPAALVATNHALLRLGACAGETQLA
ncbi:hypothetical protein ACJJTC_017590 [Scirpophaga incertulas]